MLDRRTERVYVIAIVCVGLAILILAVITGVNALSGTSRPAYENAPPSFVSGTPFYEIVNPNKLDSYPISDEDFLTLHKTTRLLAPRIAGVETTASGFAEIAASPAAAKQISAGINSNSSLVAHTKASVNALEINVSQSQPNQAQTNFQVTYQPAEVSQSPTIIVYTLFFQKEGGVWKLTSVRPSVS